MSILHIDPQLKRAASAIKAGHDFDTTYEGKTLRVYYDAEDDADFGSLITVAAITVPGSAQDLTVLLDRTVVATMDERARDDYEFQCRQSRVDFAIQRYLDVRDAA